MNLNKVILIGRLGDKRFVDLPNDGKICILSLATESTWKKDGERQSKSEWHKVVSFDEGIISYIDKFVEVGDSLYVEGKNVYKLIDSPENADRKIKTCEIHVNKFEGRISIFKKKRKEGDGAEGLMSKEDQEEMPFDI